ncbi:MAG: helix-turn-helix transcriptional regulator [Candidatus Aminicenantales bacterium]
MTFFWAMTTMGLSLIVLTRSFLSYQRIRLRFQKIFIIAFSLLLYHLTPTFIFGYFAINDEIVLQHSVWRVIRLVYYLQTPVMLALIAFFLIRLFLLLQRESWRRSWLFLFWGIQLIPIFFRFLNAASFFSIKGNLRNQLETYALLISLLAFYGSLIAVALRAQSRRFSHLSQVQTKYLKWAGRTLALIVITSLAVDLMNIFDALDDSAAGLLSITPIFLFTMACLLFLDRLIGVIYPRDESGPLQEKRFQSLIDEYGISHREKEIVRLICHGKTNKEIEKALFISVPTVKDHISNIFRKTGVSNRVQLAALFHFSSDS